MTKFQLLRVLLRYPWNPDVLFKTGGVFYPILEVGEDTFDGKTVLVLRNVSDDTRPRVSTESSSSH